MIYETAYAICSWLICAIFAAGFGYELRRAHEYKEKDRKRRRDDAKKFEAYNCRHVFYPVIPSGNALYKKHTYETMKEEFKRGSNGVNKQEAAIKTGKF